MPFPQLPSGDMRRELEAQSVTLRSVDEISAGASAGLFRNGADGFGYVMKVAVILFSSFEARRPEMPRSPSYATRHRSTLV